MNSASISIVYFGTPEFAVAPLQKIVEAGYEVKAVVTQPDRPSGRGKKLQAPAVKTYALSQGLFVLQPEKINKETQATLASFAADLFVVCAYGKILSQKIIDMPKHIINIHASLLPKYRGAAPIHAAICAGEKETGVSIMKIVKELDAGDVMLMKPLPISHDDNLETVTTKLSDVGAQAIMQAIEKIVQQEVQWQPQNEVLATYAHKIHPDDGKVMWNQPAAQIHNFIRSFAPQPGAFTYINDEKIKILSTQITDQVTQERPGSLYKDKKSLYVACSDFWIEIKMLQPLGKKMMDVSSFLNGYRKSLTQCQ
ncbi:MAG: methionyl-tRNA formyltransferase [Deltaproteobacteria bacterium]|nr:methionyl-tRNA formyltransferase [Deltaproteobacteria bacterium]